MAPLTKSDLEDLSLKRWPDRDPGPFPFWEDVIDDLRAAGLNDLDEVVLLVQRNWDRFLEYERENPTGGEPGAKYMGIGVVRTCLTLDQAPGR
jgi:hypothetical protein